MGATMDAWMRGEKLNRGMLLCKPWHFLFSRCMTGKIRLLAVMIENPRTHPFPTRENE